MSESKGYRWAKLVVLLIVALLGVLGAYFKMHSSTVTPAIAQTQSGTSSATGNNNASGVVNNQGNNNTSVIGDGNRVNVNPGPKLSGWLLPASDPIPDNPCSKHILKDGVVLLYGSSASYTTTFPRTVLMFKHQRNLILERDKKGRVTITADIFGADGRIVASIDKNRFKVNPNNYFDLESDHSTLRVIDQQKREVLFVRYLNSHAIKVRALLYFPGHDHPLEITDKSISGYGPLVQGNCVGDNMGQGADFEIN